MARTKTETLDEEPGSAAPGGGARRAHVLGGTSARPLGDLHALEHLGQHLARALKGGFEPLLRRPTKVVAEPLGIKSFDDYLAARDGALGSFTFVAMAPLSGQALIVLDGAFVLEMVDLFFGGKGSVPHPLPAEFTPTADAIAARTVDLLCGQLGAAWGAIAEIEFRRGRSETNPAMLSGLDGEDAVVVARFTLELGEDRHTPVDILYPVSALKPIAASLGAKVQSKRGGADPAWLGGLTRAVMNVKLPVRSVLAEPVIPLAQLMNLKAGDIIPISFGPEIPLLVANNKFARGAVGAANGRAAIRVNRIEQLDEDQQ